MTLRSVIFDLDYTLADRLSSIDTYLDRFLERFGDSLRAVDRQIVRAALGHADAGGHAADTRAADAVYVGDHPVNDVQGATEAGLTAIWLRGWQDWPADDPLAEHVVDCLVEVPQLAGIALATRNAASKLQPRRSPVNDSGR